MVSEFDFVSVLGNVKKNGKKRGFLSTESSVQHHQSLPTDEAHVGGRSSRRRKNI